MNFTEDMLQRYAQPLGDTEKEKCKRAIREIRDALCKIGYVYEKDDIELLESDTFAYSTRIKNSISSESIHIFIQGSYANNTCVRNESDVDIAIVRDDLYDYAFGTKYNLFTDNRKAEAMVLKDTVEKVLRSTFPYQVTRGNKSIKVKGNSNRKDADTVPCISMHYYYLSDYQNYSSYKDGIIIFGDDGSITRNFPKQHIANGKAKNSRTNFYYKKMVRIIKKIRHIMEDCLYDSAKSVSSFGLESLLWNIPDEYFTKWYTYGYAFKEIVDYLYKNKESLSVYKEANGIKPLCASQKEIENYKAFIISLKNFFVFVNPK